MDYVRRALLAFFWTFVKHRCGVDFFRLHHYPSPATLDVPLPDKRYATSSRRYLGWRM